MTSLGPLGLPVFEDAPIPMVLVSSDGTPKLNLAAEELLQCDTGAFASHPLCRQSLRNAIEDAERGPEERVWLLTPNGARIEARLFLSRMPDGSSWVCVCCADGGECQLGSPDLLSAILDDLPVGVFAMTPDARPCYVNRFGARNMTGGLRADATFEDVLASFRIVRDPTHEPYPRDELPPMIAAATGMPSTKDDICLLAASGDMAVEVTSVPIWEADGAVSLYLTIFSDQTRRRLAERALERAQTELRDARRLEGRAEVAGSVLGKVEDGVRKLLDRIRTTADSLVDERKLPELTPIETLIPRSFQADVEERSFRMRLGQEIGGARFGLEGIKEVVAAQQRLASAVHFLEACGLENLVHEAAARAGSHDLELDVQRGTVMLDRHLALEVLSNLIANAVTSVRRAAPATPVVSVEARVLEGAVRFVVSDNGLGFSDVRQLFRDDLKLHTHAVVARELEGELSAESPGLGHGATFILTLKSDGAAREHD